MKKPHLYFRNPTEGIEKYIGRIGGGDDKPKKKKVKDFSFMAKTFVECKEKFNKDSLTRIENRTIKLPTNFDLIELTFFGGFDQQKYEEYYFVNFGLVLLHLSYFNRKGLFAIINKVKFDCFFKQITLFTEKHLENSIIQYDPKINFIKSFKLFSTNDMLGNIDNYSTIQLSFLSKSLIDDSLIHPQKQALELLLINSSIQFKFNEHQGEIYNIDDSILKELLNDFDIIYASCSGSGAITMPNIFNSNKKDFGFTINNSDENLPIIGVIDTGVSNSTPLVSILIGKNGDFDTTNTGSFIDNADHGTGVAAFAAFGNKLIPDYRGSIEADAKILPIKILDSKEGSISQLKIIDLIRKAHEEYNVRIFTLTIGYTAFPLKDNQEYSSYARMLDELVAELDILIFISTTNHIFDNLNQSDYPSKYLNKEANIAPPAESMNNVTVGAIADNFEDKYVQRLAPSKEFPAMYSRKFHYNFDDKNVFNDQTANSHLRKPDILYGGGDFQEQNTVLGSIYEDRGEGCLEVLSADLLNKRTFLRLGTSYSAPLVANLAAKLLKMYPNMDMQTVKALIVNSSNDIKTGDIFKMFSNKMKSRIMGHGTVNPESLLYSTDNKVSMVIEDEISPDSIKLFPIYIPKYLNLANREKGLLKITATICFKFFPKSDNQLLYCPLHVSFAIGKDLKLHEFHEESRKDKNGKTRIVPIPEGYNGNSSKNIQLALSGSHGWAQDYYYKEKIVSNVQKINFNVSKNMIVDENNCFKIAINADFQKLLSIAEQEPYKKTIPFSLVLTIEQFPDKKEVLNSLYDELILENNLNAITEIELDAELEN